MVFDITNLDKKLLIKALYAHATPVGLGVVEYTVKDLKGVNIDTISDYECERRIAEFYQSTDLGSHKIVDYYNGVPVKLFFYRKDTKQILTSSASYDERNGKYRFLEALLNTFALDEIITKTKGYRNSVGTGMDWPFHKERKNEVRLIKNLVSKLVKKSGSKGRYWIFDDQTVYTPPFMKA